MHSHPLNKSGNLFLFLCICLFTVSCSSDIKPERSFCFWKTTYYGEREDDTILADLDVGHIYLRIFDVDWNPYLKAALPVASLSYSNLESDSLDITPSIFITNQVMLYSSKQQLDTLAINVADRVTYYIEDYKSGLNRYKAYRIRNNTKKESAPESGEKKFDEHFKELLIDCDWSEKSKGNYFYFLEKLQVQLPQLPMSATIRLWQYKYREKAGVPPVDRGLLMCYNLQSAEHYQVENSISSAAELEKYLDVEKYPFDLDIALPVFSWAVLFRGGEFKGIINDITAENCIHDTVQYAQIGENRFVFKTDKVEGNIYIRSGDELRIEKVSIEELEKMVDLLTKKDVVQSTSRVTFFSYDRKYINDYGTENINKIYSLFDL